MTGDPDAKTRFDRAAETYHDLANVQRDLAKTLLAALRIPVDPARILEAGCGSGQLTELLAARFPESRIHAFDFSPRMIAESRRRCDGLSQTTFFVADMRRLRRKDRYDLAISSSALHWATPIEASLRRMAAALVQGGTLAIALMTEGTLEELHSLRNRLAPAKAADRLPSLEAVQSALHLAGLRTNSIREYSAQTCHSSSRDLMEGLRAMGVTGGRYSRGRAPLSRSELRSLEDLYAQAFPSPQGGITASWRAVLAYAEKR